VLSSGITTGGGNRPRATAKPAPSVRSGEGSVRSRWLGPRHRPSQARAFEPLGDQGLTAASPRHCQWGGAGVGKAALVHAAPLVAEIGQGGTNPLTAGTTGPPRW